MSILNTPTCVVGTGNTGIPACFLNPKEIIGAILVHKSKVFDADTDLVSAAAFKAALQAAVMATGTGKIYPIFRFGEVADNSEDVVINTTGYGNKMPIREGKYDWTFKLMKGGICLQNHLRMFNFNKADWKVLFIDSDNLVYGVKNSDGDLAGLTLDFLYAYPFKLSDSSKPTDYQIRFALSKIKEFNDNVGYMQCDFDVEEEVKGLIDLQLEVLATALGKATIGIKTLCDKVDLFETYHTLLASVGLWTCTKAGVAVTITGVAASSTVSGWEISFTGTGVHTIGLAAPSVLAAAGVGGYPENGFEGIPVSATMPTSGS